MRRRRWASFAGGSKIDAHEVLEHMRESHVLDQVAWFRRHGIENAFGMMGGIDAWSREVDAGVMRYRVEV